MKIHKFDQLHGESGIRQTLYAIKKLVIESDKHRIVKETAKNIITECSPDDQFCIVSAIANWINRKVKYVKDINGVEEITAPYIILEQLKTGNNEYSSDCDDIAALACALLRAVGFKTRIEAIAHKSDFYNHARCSVFIRKKGWLALEITRPKFVLCQVLRNL